METYHASHRIFTYVKCRELGNGRSSLVEGLVESGASWRRLLWKLAKGNVEEWTLWKTLG